MGNDNSKFAKDNVSFTFLGVILGVILEIMMEIICFT